VCDDMAQTATSEPTGPVIDVFVNCPLCGSPEYQLLFAHKECGNIVRCAHRQLMYRRSRWTASMRARSQDRQGGEQA
jgi:hypothetical protein